MKDKIYILDNDYEIKFVQPLQVWEKNKNIVYSLIYSNFFTLQHLREDIEQICFVRFWKAYKKYDYKKGVIIGKWLKTIWRNEILKLVKKEKQNLYLVDVEQVDIVKVVDIYNWAIENMEFSKLLTNEQKEILQYILNGYEYEEIFELLHLQNNTQEKKRPIYRRVSKIKEIIARFYEMPFAIPKTV